MRVEEKSAEAVVAKKAGNAARAGEGLKEPKNGAREGTEAGGIRGFESRAQQQR